MTCPDDATIERFVLGALDDDAKFIAHVATCDACSAKLQREATAELALFDVPNDAPTVAEARPMAFEGRSLAARRLARVGGPLIAFAAAAALLVWFGPRPRSVITAATPPNVVSCPDGDEQLTCIAEARRSGARLAYPAGTRIAELGKERGLSVVVEPTMSEAALPELEAFLAKAEEDFKPCAEELIRKQGGPFVGHVGVRFVIGPDGQLTESCRGYVMRTNSIPDLDAGPEVDAELKVSRCLSRASETFPFKASGMRVGVGISAKYVWRE